MMHRAFCIYTHTHDMRIRILPVDNACFSNGTYNFGLYLRMLSDLFTLLGTVGYAVLTTVFTFRKP